MPRASGHPPPGSPSSGRPCSGCRCSEPDASFFDLGGGSLAAAQLVEPHPHPRPGVHGRRHLRPPPPRRDGRRARRAGAGAGIGRVDLPRSPMPTPRGTQWVQTLVGRAAVHPERRALAALPAHGDDDPRRGQRRLRVPADRAAVGAASSGSRSSPRPSAAWPSRSSAARMLLARLEPGDYPRGGAVHLRMWLADQIAHQVDAVGLAGAPWVTNYARALGAKIGEDVDLHTLPPVTGHAHDRRPRRDRARGRPRRHWIDGDVVRIGRMRIGADATIGARSTLLPGARIGKGAEIAPGSAVFGRVPAGQRWAGSPAERIGPAEPRSTDAPPRRTRWLVAYGVSSLLLSLLPIAAFADRRSGDRRRDAPAPTRSARPRSARLAWLVPATLVGGRRLRRPRRDRRATARDRAARGAASGAQPGRLAGVDHRAAAGCLAHDPVPALLEPVHARVAPHARRRGRARGRGIHRAAHPVDDHASTTTRSSPTTPWSRRTSCRAAGCASTGPASASGRSSATPASPPPAIGSRATRSSRCCRWPR